jgi:hypothetical protein
MRKLAKLLTVLGAAGVLIFGAAPAALAGTDATAQVCTATACPAGTATFLNNGDWFRVCDDSADGYAVAMDGTRPHGDPIRNWNTLGAGTCEDFHYDFSEGYNIPFRACIGVASTNTLVACGSYVHGVT